MIPELRDNLAKPLQPFISPSLTFGYIEAVDADEMGESRIDGYVDGREAERQAIYHIVMTERHSYPNNLPNEGIELEQFKGETYTYFKTKIEQVVRDAILQDRRFRSVKLLRTEWRGLNAAYAEFEIVGNRGNYIEGFEIPLR